MFKIIGQESSYYLCSHCDLITSHDAIAHDEKSLCPRCQTPLKSKQINFNACLIYSICGLLLFFLSLTSLFIKMNIYGIINQISLAEVLLLLYNSGDLFLALVFGCFAFLFPMMMLVFQIIILWPSTKWVKLKKELLTLYEYLRPWSMPEIFLAGVLVSFVKLINYGEIGVQITFWIYAFFIFTYLKATIIFPRWQIWNHLEENQFLERSINTNTSANEQNILLCDCCHAVYDAEQKSCPRCHRKVQKRSLYCLQFILACLCTAAILYIPANALGVMKTLFLGDTSASTILDGVLYMWSEGDYPVALIIFSASVFIPLFKILGLMRLCFFSYSKQPRENSECKKMMLLYTIIEVIGKWSMIDVFVIIILVALIQNGQLMTIYPDIGIVFFSGVVIVTIIASRKFDPRFIWDRLEDNKNEH